jgi:hypothetical protein
MASPPLEWSGALSPRAEDGNPAASNLLRALEAHWLASESIALYPKPFERALGEARKTLAQITPPLVALVGALPEEYLRRVRPAGAFLFLSWMPVGYASILSVDAPEALPDATLAMMQYGAAITVLDDIADTDRYDGVWGEGVSDAIAAFVSAHGLPAPAGLLPAIPRKARWAIDYAGERLRSFRSFVSRLRGSPALIGEFESTIGAFLRSVQTCRRVRRRIAAGQATPTELREMADAVPHGMTVVMVALLSLAQRGGSDRAGTRGILAAAEIAQRICHYQNALATLEREIADGDASNPIVLDAMEKGRLDQRTYMERQLPESETLAAVEPSRAALETRLAAMKRDFDKRALRGGVADGFLHRFGFGVRNLELLYKIARGQV